MSRNFSTKKSPVFGARTYGNSCLVPGNRDMLPRDESVCKGESFGMCESQCTLESVYSSDESHEQTIMLVVESQGNAMIFQQVGFVRLLRERCARTDPGIG